jgi:CHAD domain-containing protein
MKRTPLYAFQPGEKIGPAFIRVVEQITRQARLLSNRARSEPETLHKIRLLIKRTRALLWLAKPVFSTSTLSQVKSGLKKAAHRLGTQRDLAATQSTLQQLAEQTSKTRRRKALSRVSDLLRQARTSPGNPQATEGESLRNALDLLLHALGAIKAGVESAKEWPALSVRVKKAVHHARMAGKKARQAGSDAALHEWRKKAKRLLFVLEATAPHLPGKKVRRIKKIDALQDLLGTYHDYVIVGERLRAHEHGADLPPTRLALKLLEKKKARLRKKARQLAREAKV